MSKIYDSDKSIRLQILAEFGGDTNKHYDSTYSVDLELLNTIQGGGIAGQVIDDNNTSTGSTWSSSKILSELADAGFDIEIVQELPSTGDPHTIYFLPSADPQTQNTYDEYMYISGAWEQVGSTAIDLSDYATLAYVDASLALKADKTYVDASLDLKADKTYVDASLANKADISYVDASLANKADISYVDTNFAKLSVLTQAQYNALATKDASTLYIISDAQ